MFKIVAERKVWWPATLITPLDDGKTETQSFSVQFRLRDVDGNRTLVDEANALQELTVDGEQRPLSELYAEFVEKIAADWREVADGDTSLPFTTSNLVLAMKVPGAFEAILQAYRGCVAGDNGSRRGN